MIIVGFLGFAVAFGVMAWARIKFENRRVRLLFLLIAVIAGLSEYLFGAMLLGFVYPATFPLLESAKAFVFYVPVIIAGAGISYFTPHGIRIRTIRKSN
jgi:biotin transporter BioY